MNAERQFQEAARKLEQAVKLIATMEPTGGKRLLNVSEAARFLGLSERGLRNRLGRKARDPFPVRPKRLGGRLLFDVKDLNSFVDSLPHAETAHE